ncbi:MAG: hypothetical protein ACYCX2_02140 [Christensenellales bacterium]
MKKRIVAVLLCLLLLASLAGCKTSPPPSATQTILGKVTAISGNTITLSLGTQSDPPATGTPIGTPPPELSAAPGSAGNPPAKPSGGTADGFTPSGEEKTVVLSSTTIIIVSEDGAEYAASLAEITVGSILSVTLKGDTVLKVVIEAAAAPQNTQGSSTGSIALTGVYTVSGTTETSDGKTYTSSKADENAVLVTNGGSLTLKGTTAAKTGNTTSADESNFYGVNAIIAVAGDSKASIADAALTSSAEGANGIFATGENTAVTAKNITIHTTGNSSRGLDATYGGAISATNVNITTEGAHCAPVATDRGEGTITVTGGALSAAGEGSPCIYSTGNITLIGVSGKAAASQIAVIEGKNAITLNSCTLKGAGENGIMLYQSTSGDAFVGASRLQATSSTLSTTSAGPMFYVTNTDAEATLSNTTLIFSSGILANVAGNSTNNWGTPGSNGGNFTLTGVKQTFKGAITCDSISAVALALTESSAYTGAINAEHTAKQASVSLDATSKWNVTGNSYVSAITNALPDCTNILSNGFTVYYDAANTANAWLAGTTIPLSGGGSLTPAV